MVEAKNSLCRFNEQETSSLEASEVDSPVKVGPLTARRMRVGLAEEKSA